MVKLDLKQSIFQLDVNTSYYPNFNKRSNQNHVSHSLASIVFFNSLCFSAFPFAIFIGVLMVFWSFDSEKYFYNANNIVDFVHINNFFVIFYPLDTKYFTILPVFHLLRCHIQFSYSHLPSTFRFPCFYRRFSVVMLSYLHH